MTQSTSLIRDITAPFSSLTINSVCSEISVQRRQDQGKSVQIWAQTQAFWQVTSLDSTTEIIEIGSPLAKALDAANGSWTRTGWINDVFYVNDCRFHVPSPLEQLVILLPDGFAADLVIFAHYFGSITIAAELRGNLRGSVTGRVSMTVVDQLKLAGASLHASSDGSITTGKINASCQVSLYASSDGLITLAGNVNTGDFRAKASSSGRIIGKSVTSSANSSITADSSGRIVLEDASSPEVTVTAESGGQVIGRTLNGRKSKASASSSSKISWFDLFSENASLEGSTEGNIAFENADVFKITANASTSGKINVKAGSAESGGGSASMSGRVSLEGDFANVAGRESMSGSFCVKQQKGDGADRLTRAVRRNINRDLIADKYVGVIALSIGVSLPAQIQQNDMSEALSDETFVTLISRAIALTYTDRAVMDAIRKCGALLAQEVGPLEMLEDAQVVNTILQALEAPLVKQLYCAAFEVFLATLFKKAEAFID